MSNRKTLSSWVAGILLGSLVSVGMAEGVSLRLSWNANTESDLAGYKIYRGSLSGGPYALMGEVGVMAAPSAQVTLADPAPKTFFVVTAFDTSGNESGYSNEASWDPPPPPPPLVDTTPPAVPTGFQVTVNDTTPLPIAQVPFFGIPAAIPGIIQAEDYDKGGEGIAYHDLSLTNDGNEYRAGEAVDIQATADTNLGYNVGWVLAGEWLEYTINVGVAGTYDVHFRVASNGGGGLFHLEMDGTLDLTGPMLVSDTGGWQSWQTISRPGIQIPAGVHVLRLSADSNGASGFTGNFNFIEIAPSLE